MLKSCVKVVCYLHLETAPKDYDQQTAINCSYQDVCVLNSGLRLFFHCVSCARIAVTASIQVKPIKRLVESFH